jgi:hypothetical protein
MLRQKAIISRGPPLRRKRVEDNAHDMSKAQRDQFLVRLNLIAVFVRVDHAHHELQVAD